MRFLRLVAVVASLSLLALLTSVSIPAQQPAQSGGVNNCGTVNCAADCDCQLTKCDKQLNPNCVDVGVCVDCGPQSMFTTENIAIVTLAVAIVAAVSVFVARRMRAARR